MDKYKFKFDLIRAVGGSKFVELLAGFEAKKETNRQEYHYIRLQSLIASATVLEFELIEDVDDTLDMDQVFIKKLSGQAKPTVLYRICVGNDAIPARDGDGSIKKELMKIFSAFGGGMKGYLRLSGVYENYIVFHAVVQCDAVPEIKSVEDDIALIGEKRKSMEYSKYVFEKGVVFQRFVCLYPSGSLLAKSNMVRMMFGNKEKESNEPKLGVHIQSFDKSLWKEEMENLSQATQLLADEMQTYIFVFKYIGKSTSIDYRHYWEPAIEREFKKLHDTLRKMDGITALGRVEPVVLENSVIGDSDEKKDESLDALDVSIDSRVKYMLICPDRLNTEFIIDEKVFKEYFPFSKIASERTTRGPNNEIIINFPDLTFQGVELFYNVAIGQNDILKTSLTRTLGEAYIQADMYLLEKLKTAIVNEIAYRFETQKL